ncbi:hypothetical protein J4E93_006752 [Alternaria ventricosa]|uniref:uncharacterized protein n=1 Tax=Alternaria ventricosa TaxID=1187951 RepID=UPI0020C4A059|nr:uncharacterized protein J4E93_006752 [Alternaria ventricosa]KAI4643740.1 hypothetical protein J4E93_006752 [Alternaria ventricosa]
MPSEESETPKCNEQPAIGEDLTLSVKEEAEVERLKKEIQGEFDGRYVELVLTYTSGDLVRKYSPKYSQKCEVSTVEVDGQEIAIARLPGARQPFKKGTAALDVVTAYENLLEKIEAEKSSKQ